MTLPHLRHTAVAGAVLLACLVLTSRQVHAADPAPSLIPPLPGSQPAPGGLAGMKSLEATPGPAAGPASAGASGEVAALLHEAEDLRRKGDLPAALAKAQAALKKGPEQVPALLMVGGLEASMQRFSDAAGHFRSAMQRQPDNAFARKAYASALLENHDAEGAAKALAPLLTAKPIDTQAHGLAAQIAASRGDFDGAQKELDTILKAEPGNLPAHELGVRLAMARHKPLEAKPHLEALLKARPDDAEAMVLMANIEANTGHLPLATSWLAKARKAQPKAIPPLIASIQFALQSGHADEAAGFVSQLEALAPGSQPALALRAQVLMAQGKPRDAVKPLQTALARQPATELELMLLDALRTSNQQTEVDQQLKSWLQAHPDDIRVRMYSGESAAQRGDNATATAEFNKVLEKQPDNPMVLNSLAQSLQAQHDAKAVEVAEKAYKLQPDNPLVQNTLGSILMAGGQQTRGLTLLREAAGRTSQQPELRFDYARALVAHGDKGEARTELEALLALKRPFAGETQARELLKTLAGS